jgi:hypothetical protein
MCKHCKKIILVETSAGVPVGDLAFLVGDTGLCPTCYSLLYVKPIDKEMNRCEEILATLRVSRFKAFKVLEESKQRFVKDKQIAAKLQAEIEAGHLFTCKCTRTFKSEPEYVAHAYACQGRAVLTRKQEVHKQTRAQRVSKMQEASI